LNMAKMTKAQARKRLNEAAEKVWKVMGAPHIIVAGSLSARDAEELRKARLSIIKMAAKLK